MVGIVGDRYVGNILKPLRSATILLLRFRSAERKAEFTSFQRLVTVSVTPTDLAFRQNQFFNL